MDYETLQIVLNQYKKEMAKKNNHDAVFMIHFSAEDDKFYGFDHNLDALDVGIVVNQFFTRLAKVMHEGSDKTPPFIHYGLAKDVRDKCNDILEGIEAEIAEQQ